MNIKDWLKTNDLPVDGFAARVGAVRSSRTIARIVSGAVMPDADMVARIEALTAGEVTAIDMHVTRLDWLKANRPERFDVDRPLLPATPAEDRETVE